MQQEPERCKHHLVMCDECAEPSQPSDWGAKPERKAGIPWSQCDPELRWMAEYDKEEGR